MNFLDRIVGMVSPEAMLRRMAAREAARAYEGASKGRRTKNWKTRSGSPNDEIKRALPTLKQRSRDLTMNNSYARRAVQAIANNVVGTGIQPVVEGMTEASAKRLMRYWRQWAHNTVCDFDGMNNFWGLQKLVMRSVVEDGEVVVRLRKTNDQKFPFKIQVVLSDFIDSSQNSVAELADGNYLEQGIEFDKDGRKVAMWLFDRHPQEKYAKSNRVPMTACAHIFLQERPGQIRGVPWASASMLRLRDFDEYEDAQLLRQKVAACFAAFVQDTTGTTMSTSETDIAERLEPGIIEVLPAGKTMTFANPPTVDGYADFSRKTLQGAAAGYGITYEVMTGDLSNVNFSSGRMGWLEFNRNVQEWQNQMMVPLFCERVWQEFIRYALVLGHVTEKQVEVHQCMWTAPRREMIDPSKEVKAKTDEIRAGLISWSEAIRQNGGDPDDVAAELGEDYARFDKHGLKLASDARWDAGKNAEVTGSSETTEGEEGEGGSQVQRFENLKAKFDSYGVAVRAGAITPTIDDEEAFRAEAGLPAVNDPIRSAWQEDGGIRRPITLVKKEEPAGSTPPSGGVDDPEEE